jgi:hypothetical protein
MSDLKDQLIRLGHAKPELREHIRPVLDKIGGSLSRWKSEFQVSSDLSGSNRFTLKVDVTQSLTVSPIPEGAFKAVLDRRPQPFSPTLLSGVRTLLTGVYDLEVEEADSTDPILHFDRDIVFCRTLYSVSCASPRHPLSREDLKRIENDVTAILSQ